jgi:hypothetical protein
LKWLFVILEVMAGLIANKLFRIRSMKLVKIFGLRLLQLLTLAAGFCSFAVAQAAQILLPPNISEVETIRGRIVNFSLPSANHAIADVRVEHNAGRLTIQPTLLQMAAPDPGSPSALLREFDFDIGRLPSGVYAVELRTAGGTSTLASTTLVVKSHTDPLRTNVSGHYWNPAEPGWGMMVWHRPLDDSMFSVWFTYKDNKPYWVSINTEQSVARTNNGLDDFGVVALEMRGPPLAANFDSAAVRPLVRLFTLSGLPGKFQLRDRNFGTYGSIKLNGTAPLKGGCCIGQYWLLDAPFSFFGAYDTNMGLTRTKLQLRRFSP